MFNVSLKYFLRIEKETTGCSLKNIFACLFSIHNTRRLSRHEQVCLSRLRFERYFSHHRDSDGKSISRNVAYLNRGSALCMIHKNGGMGNFGEINWGWEGQLSFKDLNRYVMEGLESKSPYNRYPVQAYIGGSATNIDII